MGQLQDMGQVQSVPVFEEEQGITLEEDDAKEIEAGEFCRPGAGAGTMVAARPKQVQKVMAAKRSDSISQEDGTKKKKAKKA